MSIIILVGLTLGLSGCSSTTSTAPDSEETVTIDGTTYELLVTVTASRDKGLNSSDYNAYFDGGNASVGILDLVSTGQVYVNGYQVSYMTDEGKASTKELTVNDETLLWTEGGRGYEVWNWSAQKMWSGAGRELTTSAYDLVINLSYREGEEIKLYKKSGSDTASLIMFTMIDTAVITGIEVSGDTVIIDTVEETEDGDEATTVELPSDHFDDSIKAGDIIILTDDATDGLTAKKAVAVTGQLVETENIKQPDWLAADSDKAVAFSDALIERKHVAEYARNTQFIRGQRRLNLYDYNEDIIMWQTTTGYSIGFTRGDAAKGALEYGIAYAETQTANVVTSADGSDVSSDKYWVTQEVWDAYQTELKEAKALLDDESATNLDYDAEILELANALGGTEDIGSKFVQNPLGVIGSMQAGTAS
ncbi:hypothetical protein [Streptococcus merionis]|uniref:hypothetical protein n=1 Tax=Streptococcus merionis TaxID=400065 RepID=UPI0026EBF96E|nr:hypothetical protein [Streptococcus merionis]